MTLHALCGSDLRLREMWLNVNVIEFLNELSFLKEKSDIENRLPMGKQY